MGLGWGSATLECMSINAHLLRGALEEQTVGCQDHTASPLNLNPKGTMFRMIGVWVELCSLRPRPCQQASRISEGKQLGSTNAPLQVCGFMFS